MFDNMFFQKTCKLDSKGRIFLPSESNPEIGEEVLITETSQYYQLFLLKRVNELLQKMKSRFYRLADTERQEILKDLNYIFSISIKTSKVDSKKRILLPSQFAPNSDVFLQGRDTSIALFPNEEAFTEYKKSIEPRNILK